jgi:electron-transferring-flavoprotein dehydrogenase
MEEEMTQEDIISTDILIVGGGPAGLSTAIALADKLKQKNLDKRILLIEKGNSIGSHILSGAVIRPAVFKELLTTGEFDGIPFEALVNDDVTLKLNEDGTSYTLPFHPPYMSNEGNYVASLGLVCKYLANLAQQRGVEIYTGFSVDSVIYEDGKVVGVKTKDTGVDHHGVKQKNYQEGSIVKANITILAEGTRGSLAKTVIDKLNLDSGKNPQIYSLGIKEIWQMPKGSVKAGSVKHTFGYPLKDKEEFGGGFIYGMSNDRLAIGLVIGLDYKDPSFDPHAAMQVWKTHPEVSKMIQDGHLVESGAKTLPEGGWNSIPKYYDDNLMIVGDSAGFLSTARLKGIHLAVRSGICAATTAIEALEKEDTSKNMLKKYEELVNQSFIYKELYPTRNFRAVMNNGMILGGAKMGMQLLTGGNCLFVPTVENDYETTLSIKEFEQTGKESFKQRFGDKLEFDKKLTFDKVTSVFHSKAMHDEVQIPHLHIKDEKEFQESNINEYGLPCASFCPAEVYELHIDKKGNKSLRLHAENCVHCKTCDIKAPNAAIIWTTPYGGDGPDYDAM